jgi:hypothetical protein
MKITYMNMKKKFKFIFPHFWQLKNLQHHFFQVFKNISLSILSVKKRLGPNITKSLPCTPYSLRVFQLKQEHPPEVGDGEKGERLGGLNMTKQNNYLSCKDYREPNLSSLSQSDLGILK